MTAPPLPTLENAIALAASAHRGQVYPSPQGEPFILHPLRVMLRVENPIDQIVAVLHDLVEDTAYSLDDLRRLGYPDEVVAALDRLTHRETDTYDAYIRRIAANAIARRVKLADLAENLANTRRWLVSAATTERLTRYERAQALLMA